MANQAPANTMSSGPVLVKDRYEIDPAKPLPELDSPQALAYHCEDRRGAGRSLFALVCRADLPVRLGAMRALKGVQAQGLLQLVEFSPIDWKPVGRRVMAVVYERPAGGRVLPKAGARIDAIPEIQFAKKIIKPLMMAIQEISQRGVVHRAIRLDNMFWFDSTKERIVLGDCTTSPPGYDNSPVYEPLGMGMANPEGRGQGFVKDDLYALGVAFLGLLSGRDPNRGWTSDEIIRAKLAQSSYAALATEARVPLNVIEVLRGLLIDDYHDRWDLENLDLWLNGRRLNPIQPKPAKRAQRPFKFGGEDFFTAHELAHSLAEKWDDAAEPIIDGRLEIWLRRGLEHNALADAVALAVRLGQAVQGEPRLVSDFTVAHVLALLDPDAPLRYRDVRVTLDGFGAALAVTMMNKRPIRPYVEILARNLPKKWIDAQGTYNPELGHFENQFNDLTANLQTQMIGWGIERCLYELNEHLHCQSPIIEEELVSNIRELLPALDRVAARIDPASKPVDRHIAAFIGVKWERDTKVQFRAINDPNAERRTLGMVSLLAILQWRLGPPALYGLSGWMGAQMIPIIESYHGRSRRRELEREVPRLISKGSLPELYNALDNQEERQKDNEGFAWAKAEYSASEQQISALEAGRMVHDDHAEMVGQQAAAVLSILVAVVVVTLLILARMW